jgi:hypothetical protein
MVEKRMREDDSALRRKTIILQAEYDAMAAAENNPPNLRNLLPPVF